MVVPLLILVVVFYFFIIRPESKRKKAAARMRKELIVGDEITTIGGIVGRVVTIKDDTVTLETGAERSKVKIMRWAISSKGEQVSDK
ncbi:MAG: preprotein translocase subunit YajC [Oscillospiraceae bacterium]|nr:preprotein translocase subunit YajC [Oscillospiraceae bacterium]